MENAIKIVGAIIDRLPKDISPEMTSRREGFIHPISVTGSMEQAALSLIVRDFQEDGLVAKEALFETLVNEVMADYPGSAYSFEVKRQYRNMKVILDQNPNVVENALEAMRRVGIQPVRGSIRGGTDGSRLSFMGLPCANIFAGGHAFHSPLEWVSRQDMEKAVRVLVELAKIWEQRT
jgi:tripeptide aminopeptidase